MEPGQNEQPNARANAQAQLLTKLLKILGGLVVVFLIIYTFGQRTNAVKTPDASETAVASAEAAVRTSPDDISARIKLADAYLRAGREDDAISQLDEVLRVEPKNRSALMGEATIRYKQGDKDKAKDLLTRFVAASGTGEFAGQDTQLEQAYFILGQIAQDKGDHASAVGLFQNALKINGGDADALYKYGISLNALKEYKDAAVAFQNVLAFVPSGWCEPYEGLAEAYKGLKDADGTAYASAMAKVCAGGGLDAAAGLKTVKSDELRIPALYGLGLAAEHDHKFDVARGYFDQIVKLDPKNVAALDAIASIDANSKTK